MASRFLFSLQGCPGTKKLVGKKHDQVGDAKQQLSTSCHLRLKPSHAKGKCGGSGLKTSIKGAPTIAK